MVSFSGMRDDGMHQIHESSRSQVMRLLSDYKHISSSDWGGDPFEGPETG